MELNDGPSLRWSGFALEAEQVFSTHEQLTNGPDENKTNQILWRVCRPHAGAVGLCLNVRARFQSGAEIRGDRSLARASRGRELFPRTAARIERSLQVEQFPRLRRAQQPATGGGFQPLESRVRNGVPGTHAAGPALQLRLLHSGSRDTRRTAGATGRCQPDVPMVRQTETTG